MLYLVKPLSVLMVTLLALMPLHDAAAPRPLNQSHALPEPYHTPDRKAAFFDYLLPMIHEANREVLKERRWLGGLAMQLLDGKELFLEQRSELAVMEGRYNLRAVNRTDAERVGLLLKRVDIVPAALVVAQAAKESGWGTSRFATEANNYFGIWCFYRGCGVTPLRRTSGLTHEVATFSSVRQSVRYYVRTLNTHIAYDGFRDMRADKRFDNVPLIGDELASELLRYSERGLPYVREVQHMIHYNKLYRFNLPYQT
jgi:Bax protein